MKRHPALEPLSRDHNVGLILARRLSQGVDGAAEQFLEVWHDELDDHFDEEERLLIPLSSHDHRARLLQEHQAIRQYARSLGGGLAPDDLAKLGELLHDHIRWEERELFVAIENTATEDQMKSLGEETANLERHRMPLRFAKSLSSDGCRGRASQRRREAY